MNLRFAIFDLRLPSALALSMVALISIIGCIDHPMNPAATQPVTITDTATTQPSYWYAKPAPATVVYDSFATLFKTCENVARDFGFRIDRVDYREGVLTTVPLESAQIFEPWRPDVQTWDDAKQSTLQSIRRTIRFEFVRHDDGTFDVSPKVLKERQTVQERRITNVALYRGSAGSKKAEDPRDVPHGTKETDEGFDIPPRYWYAIGRDPVLEQKLAHEISERLARKGREMPTTAPSADSGS
jgi:hypothetical protein